MSNTIKTRALPFCDCAESHIRFKDSIEQLKIEHRTPTTVKNNICIYCNHYVFWERGYVAYCSCTEANLISKNKAPEYPDGRIARMGRGHRCKQCPTETFRHRVNYCIHCGNLVTWKKFKNNELIK